MKTLKKIRLIVDKILTNVCCLIFAAMVVIGTYQIVTRYFFNRPSTVSEELLTYSFTWMALLISAYVFGKRDHMRMSFLVDKIEGTPRLVLEVVIEILCVAFATIVLLWGGMAIRALTMTQKTASLGVHMGTIYTVVPVTGALIVFYGILNIIDLVTGQTEGSQREAKE
ncbi:MAG: TRAP transporter small permease [Lachnospiraceae bacterium]|nr:TRAP transporter small permease [Lachnospiraceae bacterium]